MPSPRAGCLPTGDDPRGHAARGRRPRFVNVAGPDWRRSWSSTAFFAVLTPPSKGFLSDANTQLMLQDISVVAMAAIGATLVIIAGGIDLSVGSTVAFR